MKEILIVRDGNLELTEDEFISYQSRAIECVDAVTTEEAREMGEDNGNDDHEGRVMRPRRARRRPHTGDFVYYDEDEHLRKNCFSREWSYFLYFFFKPWLNCTTATGISPFNFVKECYFHII